MMFKNFPRPSTQEFPKQFFKTIRWWRFHVVLRGPRLEKPPIPYRSLFVGFYAKNSEALKWYFDIGVS